MPDLRVYFTNVCPCHCLLFISLLQQARAEQEEEFISNTLFKKIQALQKEKETLAVNYEKEEEFLTNELSRKLMQVSDGNNIGKYSFLTFWLELYKLGTMDNCLTSVWTFTFPLFDDNHSNITKVQIWFLNAQLCKGWACWVGVYAHNLMYECAAAIALSINWYLPEAWKGSRWLHYGC